MALDTDIEQTEKIVSLVGEYRITPPAGVG